MTENNTMKEAFEAGYDYIAGDEIINTNTAKKINYALMDDEWGVVGFTSSIDSARHIAKENDDVAYIRGASIESLSGTEPDHLIESGHSFEVEVADPYDDELGDENYWAIVVRKGNNNAFEST